MNPGLMKTELQRHSPKMQSVIMVCLLPPTLLIISRIYLLFTTPVPLTHLLFKGLLFKPPLFGAYSELFAALSPQVTAKHNGGFVIPWGRFGDVPGHIEEGLKPKAEGGSGAADKFWMWCERETEIYQ